MWRRPFSIALLIGAFLFNRGALSADWAMLGGGSEHLFVAPEEVPPPYSLVWTFKAEPVRGCPASPAVVGGRLFFVNRAVVRCLDIETGAEVWRYKLPTISRSTPAVVEGKVLVGADDGKLHCFEAGSGKLLWQYVTGGPVRGAPSVSGEVVFIGSSDDCLHAIEVGTGRRLWTFKTGGDIAASPAVKGDMVISSSTDRFVYALDARTGRVRWKFDTGTTYLFGPPTIGDGVVYVPTGDRLFCLSLRVGKMVWRFLAQGRMSSAPALMGHTLYFGAHDGRVYALDARSGELKWRAKVDRAVWGGVVVTGKFLVVGTEGGMVLALDKGGGKKVWSYRIGATAPEEMSRVVGVTSPPTVASGMMFVFGEDGVLYAFSPRGIDESPPRVEEVSLVLRARDGSLVAYDLGEGEPGRLAIPGAPPVKLVAFVFDQGSGTRPDSIKVLLNDRAVSFEYDQIKGRLTADLVAPTEGGVEKPLPDGRYALTIVASDWRGRLNKASFVFTVDNTLPPPAPPEERAPGVFPGMPGGPGMPGMPGMPPM